MLTHFGAGEPQSAQTSLPGTRRTCSNAVVEEEKPAAVEMDEVFAEVYVDAGSDTDLPFVTSIAFDNGEIALALVKVTPDDMEVVLLRGLVEATSTESPS